MTLKEQQAFIQAYLDNVDHSLRDEVSVFIEKYSAGENLAHSRHMTSFMDALLMWHSAIKFNSIK
jgi:hypothetical protein